MNKAFENLSEEKRQLIFDVALKEFAENGYAKASTNNIVNEAGISKGILFHYFGSKKKLCIYVMEKGISTLLAELRSYGPYEYEDIIKRVTCFSKRKVRLTIKYPQIQKLFIKLMVENPKDIEAELNAIIAKLYSEVMPDFTTNLDISELRENVDLKKAIEMVMMISESLSKKYLAIYKDDFESMYKDMDKIYTEYMEFMEILKQGIYK